MSLKGRDLLRKAHLHTSYLTLWHYNTLKHLIYNVKVVLLPNFCTNSLNSTITRGRRNTRVLIFGTYLAIHSKFDRDGFEGRKKRNILHAQVTKSFFQKKP